MKIMHEVEEHETPDPTFPNDPAHVIPDCGKDFHVGLTKREYFAAAALQGIVSRVFGVTKPAKHMNEEIDTAVSLAARAADQLIAALNAQKGS
jgi:hypothetical protein